MQAGPGRVLFLTSTNLAVNPRCLKEVRLAVAANMDVTVVAFRLGNWSDAQEQEIVKELTTVRFYYLSITRDQLGSWLQATFFIKVSRLVHAVFPGKVFWASTAINKQSWLLWKWIKQYKGRQDLIIAHNPPAFYPAEKLAAKNRTAFALDIEDYHPGEIDNKAIETPLTVVMESVLARSAYNSFAAPGIRDHCRQAIGINRDTDIVVNNVFPSDEFSYDGDNGKGKMKLVWFSQNIDFGRGLEELIPCLDRMATDIELILIGDPKEPFCHNFVEGKDFIKTLRPVSQRELHRIICSADIGLALETGKDINRKLTLTNKIWAYYQAGLFVLASDTPAQAEFLAHFPDHGLVTPLTVENVAGALGLLLRRLPEIRAQKQMRFIRAKKEGWEHESAVLLNKWKEILQSN